MNPIYHFKKSTTLYNRNFKAVCPIFELERQKIIPFPPFVIAEV